TGHIPNALTLPPLAIGPLVHGLFGGWQAAALSLAAAVACGLLPYAMFRKGAAGGGDVKLLAALGALGGIGIGLEAQLFGFAVAAIASLVKLAWHGQLWRTFANAARLAVNPVLPGRLRRPIAPEAMATIRLGVPILAGTALAVWVRLPLLGIGV
ncbi:MAG: hypothetical protein D6689_22015, partial [Deltaproteobacteria bacterium]